MSSVTQQLWQHLQTQLNQIVFGMDDAIEDLAIALIAGGHVLVQGVPGLGKTLLAKTFAELIGGNFKRVQGTADLMPSDITGIHIYRAHEEKFELIPGPVFADVLLIDEINRSGPKTQSALLQAMEERKVTIDRSTYSLPENFMVIASQNPADFEGTYPLPESQLDRFLLRLELHYPDAIMETQVLKTYDKPGGSHSQIQTQTLPTDMLRTAREEVQNVHVSDAVYEYTINIGSTSRVYPQVSLGLSTRGVLSLMRCARVKAVLRGLDFVSPDDVKEMALPVMGHRLMLTPDAALEGIEADKVVDAILEQVEVPRQ